MTIAAGIERPVTAIADICRLHQVKELSLFGSAARGEMGPDSDFDLLIDFLPGASRTAKMRQMKPARLPRFPLELIPIVVYGAMLFGSQRIFFDSPRFNFIFIALPPILGIGPSYPSTSILLLLF